MSLGDCYCSEKISSGWGLRYWFESVFLELIWIDWWGWRTVTSYTLLFERIVFCITAQGGKQVQRLKTIFSALGKALLTATHIHVLIFQPNLATSSSSAKISIEQKISKPWELKEVHFFTQLSTNKVVEQLKYLDWAPVWLRGGMTVSGSWNE